MLYLYDAIAILYGTIAVLYGTFAILYGVLWYSHAVLKNYSLYILRVNFSESTILCLYGIGYYEAKFRFMKLEVEV